MSSRADCEARHALGASPEEVLPAVFDAMAGAVGANEELVKKKTMYIKFGCRCVSARAHTRARTPPPTHTPHTHTPLLPPTRRSHLGPGMRSVELSGCSEVPALTPARARTRSGDWPELKPPGWDPSKPDEIDPYLPKNQRSGAGG